jgi:hypothetical protein
MHGKLATVPTVLRVAVLVVVLLCASGVHCRTPVADEYAVKRYLRQRDAWLKQRFPTNDSTLDADIAAFALPEHESTVREASVTECKRQFVITYERARAGELPLKFEKYCEKPGKSSEIEPEAPTIFFIESDRGLQRATATIRAQTNKGVCIYIYIYIYIHTHTHTHTHTWSRRSARAQIRLGRGGRRRQRGGGPARARQCRGIAVSVRKNQSGNRSAGRGHRGRI